MRIIEVIGDFEEGVSYYYEDGTEVPKGYLIRVKKENQIEEKQRGIIWQRERSENLVPPLRG
jgi:hypothetical protein